MTGILSKQWSVLQTGQMAVKVGCSLVLKTMGVSQAPALDMENAQTQIG